MYPETSRMHMMSTVQHQLHLPSYLMGTFHIVQMQNEWQIAPLSMVYTLPSRIALHNDHLGTQNIHHIADAKPGHSDQESMWSRKKSLCWKRFLGDIRLASRHNLAWTHMFHMLPPHNSGTQSHFETCQQNRKCKKSFHNFQQTSLQSMDCTCMFQQWVKCVQVHNQHM